MIRFNSLQIFIIVTLLNFNIGNSVGSIIPEHVNNTDDISDVCTTVTCNVAAATILDNMNASVNPCDDFYEFACGGFIEKHKLSNDSVTSWTELQNTNMLRLKALLEESSPANETELIKQVKNFYKSCMNESAIEERGLAPLLNILEKLGGWPVIEGNNWNETNFYWTNLINEFQTTGFLEVIFLNLTIYLKNDTGNILQLSFYSENPAYLMEGRQAASVIEYKNQMVDIAVLLGASRDNATEELEGSLLFEMALENIIKLSQTEYQQAIDETTDSMTITELCDTYPNISWKTFINNTLASYTTIYDDDIVNVTEPRLFGRFLQFMTETPKRVQANYMMWKAIQKLIPLLNEIRGIMLKTVDNTRRWESCVFLTHKLSGTPSLYVKKYFNATVQTKVTELVTNVKNEMTNIIQKINWMDNETRTHALNKIKALRILLGYDEKKMNNTILAKFHKNLRYEDTKYFENILNLKRSLIDFNYKLLTSPNYTSDYIDALECYITLGIESEYAPIYNLIKLPVGSLQGLNFNAHHPNYLNYGAEGWIVGHEMTHLLFSSGQMNERVFAKEWWTASTKEAFSNNSDCIVRQFNNYTIEEIGKKLNGSRTESENIGDHGGIKIAYSAYENWLEVHKKEQSLPGLKYDPRQMFWIAAANTWCAKWEPKVLKYYVAHNEHSPHKYRILGTFSNSPEFARDFNCPVGSNMNPENKCTIW